MITPICDTNNWGEIKSDVTLIRVVSSNDVTLFLQFLLYLCVFTVRAGFRHKQSKQLLETHGKVEKLESAPI